MNILNKKLILLTLTAFSLVQVNSQNWNETQKIVASDRSAYDLFGTASISGNWAIVGAQFDDRDASGGNYMSDAGSAYIFKRDGSGTWSEVQKIVASDRAPGDLFGRFVSISDDYAIIGAEWEDEDASGGNTKTHAGSAYIFEKDEANIWHEVQKIVASDRASHDQFGCSASISGNWAIVGAKYYDDESSGENTMTHAGSPYIFERDGRGIYDIDCNESPQGDAIDAGSAYIFKRDGSGTWNEIQKIVASDMATEDLFGVSVSISGDNVIVGAVVEDENASGGNYMICSGSAYIYERDEANTWNEVQKIVASDRAANDYFGDAVFISGNWAIVGACGEDEDASGGNTLDEAGSDYIFKRDGNGTWNEVQKIVASDRDAGDHFGRSVSISDNWAIVSAVGEMDAAGSAYIFERDVNDTWSEVQKIVASDREPQDLFGLFVSISGGYAIVGANYEDEDASGGNFMTNAGSAYIFELSTVGIIENDFGASLIVCPNPTTGKFTIDLGQAYYGVDINLMNMFGQVIYTQNFELTDLISLEIEGPPGIYLVEIHTTKGLSASLRVLKNNPNH